MSELAEAVAAPETSTIEAPAADTAPSPFEGVNFESKFGLDADKGPAPEADVQEAPNPPVPRQDAEVTNEEAGTPPADEAPKPEVVDEDSVGLKQLRTQYKELKNKFLELSENDLGTQYITSPKDHLAWMEETSPQSFHEVSQEIANRAANSNPEGWIDFFIDQHGDKVAEKLTGRPLEQLKAELAVLTEDDAPEVEAQKEKLAADKPAETPEQKEIREWREERAKQAQEQQSAQYAANKKEWADPIADAIDGLVSEAGLGIDASLLDKPFDTLTPDEQFAVLVNRTLLPTFIDQQIAENPKLLSMQSRVEDLLAKGDKKGAMALQHAAKIAVTNFATQALSIVTGRRAANKQSETQSPTNDPPPKVVTGGSTRSAPDTGEIDFVAAAKSHYGVA